MSTITRPRYSVQRSVSLSPEQLHALETIAVPAGTNPSALIRQAVNEFLARREVPVSE